MKRDSARLIHTCGEEMFCVGEWPDAEGKIYSGYDCKKCSAKLKKLNGSEAPLAFIKVYSEFAPTAQVEWLSPK